MKSIEQYLQDAGNDPQTALSALHRDAERLDSRNLQARRKARVYDVLAEGLDLPADVGEDEAAVGEQAKRALARLEEAEGAADAAGALLEEMTERLGLDLSGLSEADSEEAVKTALDAAFQPLSERLERADRAGETEAALTRNRAASAEGVPESDLTEWLAGRSLTRQEQGEGDQKREVYGLMDGETFKPLSSYATFQRLKSAPTPPAPIPTPAQQTTTTPSRPLTTADLQKRKAESGDYEA